MLPRVIAVSGFKRSGKDTIADYLVKKYGYLNVKLADPLKKACKIVFDLTDEQIDGSKKEILDDRWGVSPRQIMQFFGTELMQFHIQALMPNIGRKLWVQGLVNRYANTSTPIVISDLRFTHEYEEIKKTFGKDAVFIRVSRPHHNSASDVHSSEHEWMSLPSDHHFNNEGSIEELYTKVDSWFAKSK